MFVHFTYEGMDYNKVYYYLLKVKKEYVMAAKQITGLY